VLDSHGGRCSLAKDLNHQNIIRDLTLQVKSRVLGLLASSSTSWNSIITRFPDRVGLGRGPGGLRPTLKSQVSEAFIWFLINGDARRSPR
jgi:hypothetical protein